MKPKFSFFYFLFYILLLLISHTGEAKNSLSGVRLWPTQESTRVVLDFAKQPEFSYFMLKSPRRLVVDIQHTTTKQRFPTIPNKHKLIQKIRYSTPKKKRCNSDCF